MKNLFAGSQQVNDRWALLLVLCFTVICFSPTFFNGFQMEWDDQWMVVNSQTVGHPSRYLLLNIFTIPSHGQIGPLNQLMYTLLYRCFGFSPLAYHVTCLLLHMVNIILLYVGLNLLIKDCSNIPSDQTKRITLLTTILFAIHPLQVETVAWVSASKIILSTTFYFTGAIMLMQYLRKSGCCWWWYLGALLMQLLAYLSKEQAVVFPLLAFLLYIWYGRRLYQCRFWMEIAPFFILGSFMLIHEIFYVANYDLYVQGETYVWWQRLVFCVYSLITYFFKWLVPINLNWMYLFPIEINEEMPLWLILYPILFIFVIYAFWGWIKKPLIFSLLAFYIIHLLLVIHITVLPRASVVADRYMYISIISLNFLFAYYVTWIYDKIKRPRILISAFTIMLALLVGTSYNRTMDWKDSKTLRNAIIQESGNNMNDVF